VESDRLRLIGAEDGAVPFRTSKTGPLPPAVVENTGILKLNEIRFIHSIYFSQF
jgi:hypothetical protein